MAMAMACSHSYPLLSTKLQTSVCNSPIFSYSSLKFPLGSRSHSPIRVSSQTIAPPTTSRFTWEDIFQIAQEQRDDSSDLQGFFDRIAYCNRNPEKHSEFIPFVIEDQIIGYVHNDFTNHLRRFVDVFVFINDNSYGSHFGYHVTLHPRLTTPDDRTSAVDNVVKCLGEELFPGIRNERYPVMSSYGTPVLFSLERAAAPYFGIKVYGVHLNGYVEKDGQKYLWIAKRSDLRPTYPGMLDHIAAGGLPHGISSGEHLVKESEEEAGIPSSIANKAIPVGAISYTDIDGYIYKRDIVFCYDLKLPEGFTPKNQDGEADSFKLIPATLAANIVKRGQIFKANCNLSMIDFLVQHGYIKPEDFGYLKLVKSLRSGDCS